LANFIENPHMSWGKPSSSSDQAVQEDV